MKLKNKNVFLFWSIFCTLLLCLLVLQTSLEPRGIRYSWTPYFTLPALIFCFLYYNVFSSLILLIFMSFLSSAFSPLPVPSLFFVFCFCFFIVIFLKFFFLSKSYFLFFVLTFLISLFFPYIIELSYFFSINDFSLHNALFTFLKAFMTLLFSIITFPVLKKYLQES